MRFTVLVMPMRKIRAREGDFVETFDNLIFDVKGLVHPPDRVIAYVRYVQDSGGDRQRGNAVYRKIYSLGERERLLEREYPRYLFYDPIFGERLQGVSIQYVSIYYQPTGKVLELLERSELDEVERQAIEFVQCLHDSSRVPFKKLGLSGSMLVGLHTNKSDIDPIVYGRKNCVAVYEALKRLMQKGESPVSQYGSVDLKRLYSFRSRDTQMPFRDFLRIERWKVSQGKFKDRDFFIRFILDWNEVDEKYGYRKYVPMGYARIKAKVQDDSNSIFTPCSYKISETKILEGVKVLPIEEIVSFRGRFCEQAVEGETVIAQGKAEKVIEKDETQHFRLILGARTSDFMLSKCSG